MSRTLGNTLVTSCAVVIGSAIAFQAVTTGHMDADARECLEFGYRIGSAQYDSCKRGIEKVSRAIQKARDQARAGS
jgi:hypothetical protein